MKKILLLDSTAILRCSVLVLCLILTFTFVARPPTVSAAVVETAVTTLVYGGSAVSVPWGVAVVVVVLIALGCTGTLDELVDLAYGRLSTSMTLTEWTGYMTYIAEGTVIPVPTQVEEELEEMAKEMGLDDISISPSLRFPSTLYDLDKITASDVFVQTGTNTITSQFTGALTNLQASIQTLTTSVTTGFDNLKAKVIEWGSAINYNTGQLLIQCKSWIADVNANVVKYGADTVTWAKNINSNLTHYYNKLEAKLNTLINSLSAISSDGVADGSVSVDGSLDSVTGSIGQFDSDVGNVMDGMDDVSNFINDGLSRLSHYGNALAIVMLLFNRITDIPVFNFLLTISLSLGLLGLSLNLANTIISTARSKGDAAARRVSSKVG